MKGERLAELRKDFNLTQSDLGQILNLSKHAISSYECNKSEPPDSVKVKIAKYFGVTSDYLLGLTDNPKVYSLTKNYIALPENIPGKAINEISFFLEFLAYKYKNQ